MQSSEEKHFYRLYTEWIMHIYLLMRACKKILQYRVVAHIDEFKRDHSKNLNELMASTGDYSVEYI
jgi:hypothetical protein